METRKESKKRIRISEERRLSKLYESVRDLCPKNGTTRMYLMWKPSSLEPGKFPSSRGRQESHRHGKSVGSARWENENSSESLDEKSMDFCVISRHAIIMDPSRMLRASCASSAGQGASDGSANLRKVKDRDERFSNDWMDKTFLRERGGIEGRKSRERLISVSQWLQKREQILLSKLSLED